MFLYIISVGVALIIALAVYLTNPKRQINIFFALFVVMAALWLLGVFLPSLPDSLTTLFFRLAIAFSILMALMMHYFIVYLIDEDRAKGAKASIIGPTIFAVSVTLSPFVITATSKLQNENGLVVIQPARGILYPLVMAWILFLAVGALRRLYRQFRLTKEFKAKTQLRLTFLAFLIALIIAAVTNILLPNISGDTKYNEYAPLALASLTVIVGYSILKHRFLNIRLLVARAVTYLFTLIVVGLFVALSLFTASTFIFEELNFTPSGLWLVTSITVFIAFAFQPSKRFFDKATRRIFLRELYDTQQVLDQLSSLLATEINLQTIVVSSSAIIRGALNPSYLRFVVFKDGESYIDEGDNKRKRAIIRPEVDVFSKILISRDNASGNERKYLDLYDADVLLKLRTNEETVGTMLLGPKQSGTVYTQQDIDLLTISEKELAISVQNSRYFEQIQEFNIKLQKEVEQATAELRTSNAKLKALDEAKDEFISMASHQLRTPLTSVKGYISMVTDGDAGAVKPEQKRLLDEAFASSQRMVYLIADLLNVSRLRTGKFIIEPNEVDLAEVVEQEINQLKPTARSRRLKVSYNKPARFPKVVLDETKMRQVIMNFIDNAIYYTPAGGNIEIRLLAKKDSIEYTVRDDGIGVPKEDQQKLFTKFFRAGNARKSRPDGTGLGLYMAQRVVSAQGGSIIFKSTKGKGSVFGFTFPLKKIAVKPTKK